MLVTRNYDDGLESCVQMTDGGNELFTHQTPPYSFCPIEKSQYKLKVRYYVICGISLRTRCVTMVQHVYRS